ncbi:MAG: HAD-IC family P-type ATPase [Coriobacteriales bacterium]|nr:HAD-IC family P-type ATPase [Coriobacteriales bacterium]
MATWKGLTGEEAAQLARNGKSNAMPTKSGTSVAAIVASNVFTYFNGIFVLLAVLLVVAGSYKNLTILPVIVANMIIGIVQQLRAKQVLDKLALLDVSSYTAVRDGQDVLVPMPDLVLGDVVVLEAGQQIPADAVVLEGEAGVNESLLTGEQDEVQKSVGSELMSGSFVVAGRIVARLTHVGADSYAARLTAQAKEVKDKKSQMVADIDRIILAAGIIIIPVGGLLYWRAISQGVPFSDAITSMVSAVVGMIPEGLYLLVTIALALSAMRLAKKSVLLHDMRSIETLARVDVLCVDKTGTITSGDMVVEELLDARDGEQVRDDALGLLSSYVATVSDANATINALRSYVGSAHELPDAEVTPFSSKLKYSQVVSGDVVYRLGAPEMVLGPQELETCRPMLDERAEAGMRVITFAQGTEEACHALLHVCLRNEIRPDAAATFAEFARQDVGIKVISGDNPVTVSKVAQQAGIKNASSYVSATELDSPQKMRDAVRTYTVFGRVTPEQKKELVLALKDEGLLVAMTGDGVNDILAMKEADCSIAMGSGSDAARQAAQVVLLDNDFASMNDIVFEGRRDINNITRSATLFLYKNIFSLSMALFAIFGAFTYPLTPNQVALISFFNIGLPAFLLAFEPNDAKQKGRFVAEVLLRSLPAALTSFVAIAFMMVFARLFEISQADVATASTYLLSVVGFLILIRLIQPPNMYRIMVLCICSLGFIGGCGFFWRLFDINNMSMRAWVLCAVFAFAEVGVLQILSILLAYIRGKLQWR